MGVIYPKYEGVAFGVPDWRDRICATFVELDCEEVDPDLFFGAVVSSRCDDLRFSSVRSTRQRVIRSKARLAQSSSDDFLLSLQICGTGIARQGGRESFQRVGDAVLYDTSRIYELAFEGEFQQLILTLPREQLLRVLPNAEDLTAIALAGTDPATKLATSYVNSLAQECSHIAPSARRIANMTTFDLVAMAFNAANMGRIMGKPGDLLFNRASQYIDENLVDPELSPLQVAAAMGVSLRYLNMVFAKHEVGVSRTIWHRRVLRAARDLQNRALSELSITSIAFALGFNDSAHFTRAFRRVYGQTPSAFRHQALMSS